MRRGWRIFLAVAVAAALALGVGAIKLYYPGLVLRPVAFFPGPGNWTTYADAEEWTVRFPNWWHARWISDIDPGGPYTQEHHGVIISNTAGHLDRILDRDRSEALPTTTVTVRVMYAYEGGFSGACLHDRPLPLSLKDARVQKPDEEFILRDADGIPVKQPRLLFSIKGVPHYSVSAWIGSKASPSDLAVLDQIVASIWYEPSGHPEAMKDCRWPE